MRTGARSVKPKRERRQPLPGKAEEFWAYKSGDAEALWNRRVTRDSLAALEEELAQIDAEHAKRWPRALHLL